MKIVEPSRLRATITSVATLFVAIVAIGFARHALHSRQIAASPVGQVNFSRDIRPILNQNCVGCHGGVRQKAGVSFIFRDEALGTGKSGHRTIVPGNPNGSELMVRVLSPDSEAHMPYHGPRLSDHQIGLLRQWIKEGAQFDDYWAFVPPKPQPLPEVQRKGWIRQPLDTFVLARLEKEHLSPSPEAGKAELLRRASLDITGLPPTPQEEAAFAADNSANAYEKQVDRLLASLRYGERWASMWLDLARYADSMGFEKDLSRNVWPYRDWVVNAFNSNMPYDRFLIRQLAGDLLPDATMNDRIATTFHRLTPNNDEGGTDDEEYRMIAVMDRVATTWQITSGVTMNCVQCHSHPYDPIRHADYYKSLAFFNTQRDSDLTEDTPVLPVPSDHTQYAAADKLEDDVRALVRSIESSDRAMEAASAWKQLPIDSAGADDLVILKDKVPALEKALENAKKNTRLPAEQVAERVVSTKKSLDESRAQMAAAERRNGPAKTFTLKNGEAFAKPETPAQSIYQLAGKSPVSQITALRIQVPPIDAKRASHTPEDGFIVNRLQVFVVMAEGQKKPVPMAYFAQDSEDNLMAAEREGEKPGARATAKDAASAKVALKPTAASHSGGGRAATTSQHGKRVEKANAVPAPPMKAAFAAAPRTIQEEIPNPFAALPKLFQTRWMIGVPAEPVTIGKDAHLEIDIKQVGDIDSKPAKVTRLRIDVSDDAKWTQSIGQHKANTDHLFALDNQLHDILTVPVPVMVEQQPYERRATLEFERGNFLTKVGLDFEPDVPAIFPKFPKGAPRNRLTLAKWFFQPDQPLTARVAVNRYWEELFGTGIVETLENFGSVGELPSHPELLDYLALHFQNDLHWNTKALIRDATGSNRYRRAIYTFVKRTSGYPSTLIFDASDRDVMLPRRIPTNTPLQALVTLNDPVYQEASTALALRVMNMTRPLAENPTGEDILTKRLRNATELVLSRPPTDRELTLLRQAYERALRDQGSDKLVRANYPSSTHSSRSAEITGLTTVGNILFNLDAALVR